MRDEAVRRAAGICTHAQAKDGFCPGPFLYGCQTEGPACHERDEEDQMTYRQGPGPWIVAAFDSECSWGDDIEEGDEIRADGDGGWEHRECAVRHGSADEEEDDEVKDYESTMKELFGF